jgi:twinkle protein
VDDVLEAMEHAHYVHDVGHVILDNLQFMTSGQGKGYERCARSFLPRTRGGGVAY